MTEEIPTHAPASGPSRLEAPAVVAEEAPRDLAALGFTDRFAAIFAPLAEQGFSPGRVSRVDRGQPLVLTTDGALRAELAAHLRENEEGRLAVGDWVALARPEAHDLAIVETVLPRSSAFVRKDPGEHTIGQVLAANVDVLFIVQSLAPKGPNLARLERELVLAWDSGALPVVVLTKADLTPRAEDYHAAVASVALGVDIAIASGITGEGIEELAERHLGPGRTAAFFGSSGVGKSTLVNRLIGTHVANTAAVREGDGKGRHTTVVREMYFLADGSILIDTPGMRALALWDSEEGIAAAFPDIEEAAQGCRFADCTHAHEPGCAVRAAVDGGDIPERRLESYQRLREEMERLVERQDVRARVEKKRGDKALAREIKRVYKERGR